VGESRGLFCLCWPTLGQQSGIGARSLPQSSGKQDYVSRQVEKNLTEVLLKADAGAQQVFTSREAIAEEQQKLNLLGFYGQNGKPLREDGILDQDTLLAWNDKTYGGVLLGSNNSPMAKAQREWEKGESKLQVDQNGRKEIKNYLISELWDIVSSDRTAMQQFAETGVFQLQTELHDQGYTGPNGEEVVVSGILDENTLYAWYLRESGEDFSNSFSEELLTFVNELTVRGTSDNMDLRLGHLLGMSPKNIVKVEEDYWLFGKVKLAKETNSYEGSAALSKIIGLGLDAGLSIYATVTSVKAAVAAASNPVGFIAVLGFAENAIAGAIGSTWKVAMLIDAIASYAISGKFDYTEVYPPNVKGLLKSIISVGYVN